MAEPKIFTKNYISEDDTITYVSGSAAGANLYDRDKAVQWSSVGSDDSTQEIIDITFNEGSAAATRTFRYLVILNHNLKNWSFEHYDSGSWTQLHAVTGGSDTHTIVDLGSNTSDSRGRFKFDTTQSVDAQKVVGQLMILGLTLDVGYDFTKLDPDFKGKSIVHELADGTDDEAYSRRTGVKFGKWKTPFTWRNIPRATVASLQTIWETRAPFTIQPESTAQSEDFFLVRWTTPFKPRFVNSAKSLFALSGIFGEV